ncbi:MAG: hypothetical protein EXR71_01305 [Myxococcales bacterium]|nr:hypothetical protein [Myxococcales bacterium]
MILTFLFLVQTAFAGTKGSDVLVVTIQRPEVAIIMNKQHLTPKYDLELQQSFLPKVVASVKEKPF